MHRPPKRDGRAVWLDVRSALEAGLVRTSSDKGRESLDAAYAAIQALRGSGREISFEMVGAWCVENRGGPTAESIRRNERLADVVRVAMAVQAADERPGDERPVEAQVLEQVGDADLRALAQLKFAEARSYRREHATLLLLARRVAALATVGAEMGHARPMAEVAMELGAPAGAVEVRAFSDEEREHCLAFLSTGLASAGLSLDEPSGEVIDRSMRTVAGPGVLAVLRSAAGAGYAGPPVGCASVGEPAATFSRAAVHGRRKDLLRQPGGEGTLSWPDVADALAAGLERTESSKGAASLHRVNEAVQFFRREGRPITIEAVGAWCLSEHGGPKAQSIRNNQRLVDLVQVAQAVQEPEVRPASGRPVEDRILEQVGNAALRAQAAALLAGRRSHKAMNDALRAGLKRVEPLTVLTEEMAEAALEDLEALAAAIKAARAPAGELEFPATVRADCRRFLTEGLASRGLSVDGASGEIVDRAQRTVAGRGVASALGRIAAGG